MAGTEDKPIIYPPLEMPGNVERDKITIWCMGAALDADIYRPKDMTPEQNLPAVVLCHGMGGDKLTCERYAASFASSGIVAVAFSQISWGDSDGRVSILERPVAGLEKTAFTARVAMADKVIDPFDWIACFRSVVDYLSAEPGVDPGRIGAWGTSFGGGTALWATSTDSRIKALSVQVPALFNPPAEWQPRGQSRAQSMARGELSSIGQTSDALPGVPGSPMMSQLIRYNVGDQAEHIRVPTLILDAANEELFDIAESGAKAHKTISERGVPTHYEVIPGIDHYGIYFAGYEQGCRQAKNWFLKYL